MPFPSSFNGTKVGDRVELERQNDIFSDLTPGTRGTVTLIDDVNTVHVKWDNGSTLGLCYGDRWRVLPSEPATIEARDAFTSAGGN